MNTPVDAENKAVRKKVSAKPFKAKLYFWKNQTPTQKITAKFIKIRAVSNGVKCPNSKNKYRLSRNVANSGIMV